MQPRSSDKYLNLDMSKLSHEYRNGLYVMVIIFAAALIFLQQREQVPKPHASLPGYGKVPEFSLTSEDSTPFTTREMRGHVTVADFIFTTCGGPCPLMSAQMQQLQKEVLNETSMKLLSVTVDPAEDTPAVLDEYAKRFGAVKGKWTFLTGVKARIYDLMKNGFHLSVEADTDAITHSTKFVLIDTDLTIRGYYDSGDDSTLIQLMADARALAKER